MKKLQLEKNKNKNCSDSKNWDLPFLLLVCQVPLVYNVNTCHCESIENVRLDYKEHS